MDPESTRNKLRSTGRLGELLPHISNTDLEKNRHCLAISHLLSISNTRTIPTRIECPRLPKSSRYKLQEKLQEKQPFLTALQADLFASRTINSTLHPTTVFKHSIHNLLRKYPPTCYCLVSLQGLHSLQITPINTRSKLYFNLLTSSNEPQPVWCM